MSGSPSLQSIQVLRAFAALLVVLDHSIYTAIAKFDAAHAAQPFAVEAGSVGVKVFFAISGFIMAMTTREAFGGNRAAGDFMLRRLWRIVPLYWLATAIYVAKLTVQGEAPASLDVLRSLLFIPYIEPTGEFGPVYDLGWTLNFEMYFYAVFALAMLLPRRQGLAAVSGFLLLCVAIGWVLGWQDRPGEVGAALAFTTSPHLLYFLVGIAVHEWRTIRPPARGYVNVAAGLAAFSAAILVMHFGAVSEAFADAATLPLVGLLLFASTARRGASGDAIGPLAVLLGDASYSIYLTHAFVLGPAGRAWDVLPISGVFWPLFVVCGLVAGTAVGVLVHLYVERPMLDLMRPRPAQRRGLQA